MKMKERAYELRIITDKGTGTFEFFAENLILARDHSETLLRDFNGGQFKVEGVNYIDYLKSVSYRRVGSETWRYLDIENPFYKY